MIINQFSGVFDSSTVVERALWCKYRTNKGDFVDGISGLYNSPLGFGRTDLAEVMQRAASTGFAHNFPIYPGNVMTSGPQEELSGELLKRIPFAKGVFYTNSGSEAVDAAIRFTRTEKRLNVVVLGRSYHGSTDLARKASGNLNPRAPDGFVYGDFFDHDHPLTKEEWLQSFKTLIKNNRPDQIACILVEPMIGASGGLFMKENVLPEIHDIAKFFGIKLILDEVITGFWRLGTEFAHQLYRVQPDLVVLSKAITNGTWPLSVVVVKEPRDVALPNYGFTMAGHPVGCSLALESLKLLDQYGPKVNEIGEAMQRMFSHGLPEGVVMRCVGAFAALHFYKEQKERYPASENVGANVAKICFEKHHAIVRGNPLSVILAPLFIDQYEGHQCTPYVACSVKEAIKECFK
jgi:adenosylmethionine-8-amino-7-oxononanoate aminotransferase